MNFRKLIYEDRCKGISLGKIAKKYKIGKSSVDYILKNFRNIKRKPGPKYKITKNDQRHIKTDLSQAFKENRKCSTLDLAVNNNLNVSRSTVWRTLKQMKFSYQNIPRKLQLTPTVKRNRVEFAKKSITSDFKWDNVIFSDEKFFTLNGIDSYHCWIEFGQSPKRIKKLARSSGFMTWAMIMPNGLLSYKIIKGKLNSINYINLIERAKKIMLLNYKSNVILQQDNATCHVSNATKLYLKENNIETMPWPSHSPDINIIENIWAILSRDIYNGPKIRNLSDLKLKLFQAVKDFNETRETYTKNLYKSMNSRLISIIVKRGDLTKY